MGIVRREVVAIVTLLAKAAVLALGSVKSSDVSSDWMMDSTVCACVCMCVMSTRKTSAGWWKWEESPIFMGPHKAANNLTQKFSYPQISTHTFSTRHGRSRANSGETSDRP